MSRRQSTNKKNGPVRPAPVIPVDSSDDSDEVFEVEAILDKRILAGNVSVSIHLFLCVCWALF